MSVDGYVLNILKIHVTKLKMADTMEASICGLPQLWVGSCQITRNGIRLDLMEIN